MTTPQPSTAGGSAAPAGRRQFPFYRSLMFRVPVAVAGSALVILALVFLLMEAAVKPRLREFADTSVAQSSALIGQELRKRVTLAGTLCQALARTGELLPQTATEHMRVLPQLVGGVGDDWFIAGGGVWPEAGLFTPGVERRCFFFGREPDGRLKYYDDYNDPAGPGYHHEEWYVPVRFAEKGTVYWSRSYVDPYSHEPMVTCSSPMYRDGRYYGVATIDVKLSGLREFFRKSTSEIGGYAFAVDREGVFLTFPDDAMIRTVRRDDKGVATDAFLSTRELAALHPAFAAIDSALGKMDVDAIGRARADGRFSPEVAGQIDEGSYQINAQQADLIAGLLRSSKEPPQESLFGVEGDVQLREGCIVDARTMPDTGWKIVTVMPESRVFAASQQLYQLLMLSLGGVMILVLGGVLLFLHRDIVRPITRMTGALGRASGGRPVNLEAIPARDGEVGLLAATINAYARSLAGAMGDLARHKDELELTVDGRTRELRESNAALECARRGADSANQAKSEFLANMSHEIRTPLTAILGFADLLNEDEDGAGYATRRRQAVETIKNAGQHLLTVINDVLDLSKIEADKMTVERISTPLVDIVREVESMMRPRAAGKGIALNAALSTPVPLCVVSDPTRLRQILMNLTGNAVKFTEGGRVSLTVGEQTLDGGSRLVFDIEDTGPGMDATQAGRLFAAFGQADSTVTRKHGGTGLGLTISRRLANLMGGDVSLVRSEPGHGSCFRLVLPLEVVEGSPKVTNMDAVKTAEPSRPNAEAVKVSGRILLAEDGPDNQRLITLHLKKAGAVVDVAADGEIAMEMLDKAAAAGKAYDMLLTDMQMPRMDGYTLARTLRKRGSTLAIVALTAHAMAEDRARCLEAGCDDYATKPIDRARLIATCAKWVGAKGGRVANQGARSDAPPAAG